ncbi:MAG TPA: DNA mismatch repair protein MutT [Prolixibacteraceae bacterium]|nr:DNA mismatch repair protein MutT [Prolixibacteraceae bacterium]
MAHPIHVFKYCPRCGSDLFRASGARSLTCDSCSLQWYTNSAAAVACLIFNPNGKLLVTRRAIDPDIGKMDLPGGFIDPLESAEDAVRRELKEELNMEVKNMVYLTSKPNEYFFSGITVFTTDLAFRVEAVDLGNLTPHDDISSFEWIDPTEIDPNEIPAPSIRYFIKEIAPHESNHR